MPPGKAVKGTRYMTITAVDGVGNRVLIADWNGESTISNLRPDLVAEETIRGRGRILGYVATEEQVPTFEITTHMRNFSGAIRDADCGLIVANLHDVLLRRGAASSFVTTASPCQGSFYAVDLELKIDGPSLGDPAEHLITLKACKAVDGSLGLAVAGNTQTATVEVRGGITGNLSLLFGSGA